ncbi:MAG: hypothetical protein OXF65_04490 [Acidimicrobiaceae bacterium]|nr:hypothetical protein [Acidimicrobiaceae bacterium]
MKRFSAAMTAVLVVASLTLTLVTAPAGAAGGKAREGDTTTEVEVPPKVEKRTAKALKALDDLPEDAKPQQFPPCIFGVGWCSKARTDTGYLDCGGTLLKQIGVSWKANRGYDTIHLVPTNLGRASSSSPAVTIAGAHALYGDMHKCLDLHNLRVTVKSWSAIWQQLHCHIVYQIVGGGGSWDLEGHRRSNWRRYLTSWPPCSW